MKSRKREVTVAEVASRAGVGKATASRALGGYGLVSEDARARVRAAAEELGYRPNGVARAMNTGRSRTIGVVVGDIENGYFGLALRGISDVAQAAGYDVILLNTGETVSAEIEAVQVLLDKRVDGVIVAPASGYATKHLRDVIDGGRPLVLLDRRVSDLEAHAVWVDLETAAREAVDALIGQGHRRIAFLSSMTTDGDRFTSLDVGISSVRDRLAGIIGSMTGNGIPIDPELLRFRASDRNATRTILGGLLDGAEPPSAVIASDSRIALNVLRVLGERGLRVPEDVTLVVFDALEWTEFLRPPLPGVIQPTYEVGRAAASTLLWQLNEAGHHPASKPLRAAFRFGESIARPASAVDSRA